MSTCHVTVLTKSAEQHTTHKLCIILYFVLTPPPAHFGSRHFQSSFLLYQSIKALPLSAPFTTPLRLAGAGTPGSGAAPRSKRKFRSLSWCLPLPSPQPPAMTCCTSPEQLSYRNIPALTRAEYPALSPSSMAGGRTLPGQQSRSSPQQSSANPPSHVSLLLSRVLSAAIKPVRSRRPTQRLSHVGYFKAVFSTRRPVSVCRQTLSSSTNKLPIAGSALMTFQLGLPTQTIKKFNSNLTHQFYLYYTIVSL